MYTTDKYEGLIAETVSLTGANGGIINAYMARPLGPGPYPAMVLAHHMPGWDQIYREFTFKFANHGYVTIMPNLYFRAGHGTPEDVAAKVRGEGGIPDDQAVGDLAGAMRYVRSLPYVNGKVGIFGTCSGGRHAYLTACRAGGFDAVIDCWGGNVAMAPEQLDQKRPVALIDYAKDLSAPLLGLFGNDDKNPNPEQVNQHEAELKKYNKNYHFHRYDGAGHGFFYYHAGAYRQAQAVDGWQKVFAFLEKYLV
jgi:carboxymethylenebutenolidase